MRDKTWKLSYMRTEPGALYIQVFHKEKKPIADIVVTSDDKIIILNGEKN